MAANLLVLLIAFSIILVAQTHLGGSHHELGGEYLERIKS
jgi:hypothetical protein